jgi:hypothetical protein
MKKHKKARSVRVVLTNIFMAVSVVAIVAVLTLVAMGYSLNKDWSLERSGLVQIESSPSGALVEIDGKVMGARTAMSQMLGAGEHEFLVSRAGYDTWSRKVGVEAGLLTRINWVRLFPTSRNVEVVKGYEGLEKMSVAPNGGRILVIAGGEWEIIDGLDDKIKYTTVNVLGLPAEIDEGAGASEVEIVEWSRNANKVIVRIGEEWAVVDFMEGVFNIEAEFVMGFSDMKFISDGGEKLVAVENGNLRYLDVRAKTVSAVVAEGVSGIAVNGSKVFYGREGTIYARREGDSKATRLYKVSGEVGLAAGSYFGDEWAAYAEGERLYVYRAGEKVVESDVGFSISGVSAGPNGRLVLARGEGKVAMVDLEEGTWWAYEVEGTGLGWLDDFILWTDMEGKLVVRDFDGGNRREIGEVAEGFGARISSGGRYLYFVEGGSLRREKL